MCEVNEDGMAKEDATLLSNYLNNNNAKIRDNALKNSNVNKA